MFYIYRLTLKATGKSYIGMSINPERRRLTHFREAKRTPSRTKWLRAITKHATSSDDLVLSLVSEHNDKEEAAIAERREISRSNSICDGYNTHEGGLGGRSRSPEQLMELSRKLQTNNPMANAVARQKAMSSLEAYRRSASYHEHIVKDKARKIERFTGVNNPNWGQKMSPQRKRKMTNTKATRLRKILDADPTALKTVVYELVSPSGESIKFVGQKALFAHLRTLGIGEWAFRGHFDGTPIKSGRAQGWSVTKLDRRCSNTMLL